MTDETYRREIWDGYCDRAYEYLGCHRSKSGYVFRVWAPNAKSVRLVGRFNDWNVNADFMNDLGGIWEIDHTSAKRSDEYKYCIERPDGTLVLKADPYGVHHCTRPETASRVYDLGDYKWGDSDYRRNNPKDNA